MDHFVKAPGAEVHEAKVNPAHARDDVAHFLLGGRRVASEKQCAGLVPRILELGHFVLILGPLEKRRDRPAVDVLGATRGASFSMISIAPRNFCSLSSTGC
jgi:hypothetical protein